VIAKRNVIANAKRDSGEAANVSTVPTMAPVVRLLTASDIPAASTLSTTSGWNQRIEDWRKLQQIAPGGSFCAIDDGRIVGTAIGIDYRSFGWIAMMLVDPAYRGRGLGAALLEAAMQALPADNPIRLDATPLGRPLYQRYGFVDDTMLSRRVAPAAARRVAGPRGIEVRPLTIADLRIVEGHDAGVFGSRRTAVFEWLLQGSPQYASITFTSDGTPQYAFGRPGRLFDHIGPIVACDDSTAMALVAAAVRAAGDRAMVIDAFDAHPTFSTWLEDSGFASQRPLFRMCRPGRSQLVREGLSLAEYAILGPEFG
jgi:predicted N-acetyltransferase YhbS